MKIEESFIKELEFTLNTNQYKYEYGDIMYKNELGHWSKLFTFTTIYTDDNYFLERCCRFCVQAFRIGVNVGKHERSKELRELLEIIDIWIR